MTEVVPLLKSALLIWSDLIYKHVILHLGHNLECSGEKGHMSWNVTFSSLFFE